MASDYFGNFNMDFGGLGGFGGFGGDLFNFDQSAFGNNLMNVSFDTDWGNGAGAAFMPWGDDFGSEVGDSVSKAISGGGSNGGGLFGGLFGEDGMFGGNLMGNGGLPSLLQAGMTIPAYMLEKDNLGMMQDMMDWQKQAYEEDVARQEQQWNYNVEQQAANQQYVADTEGNLQLRDNYYDTPTAEEALSKWGM